MGQALIVSGGADGLYSVKLDYGKAKRDDAIIRIIARMGELAPAITQVQGQLDEQQALEDQTKAAVTAAIDAYVAATQAQALAYQAETAATQALATISSDPSATPAQLAAAQAHLSAAQAAYAAAQKEVKTRLDAHTKATLKLVEEKRKTAGLRMLLDILRSELTQLEKDLAYWQGLMLEETLPAWCADLTEDATGTVATIEIPGESRLVLIAPAAPAPVPLDDGLLTAREVQTPAQVYFNAAILPGWQKYKPTYRRGVITALNQDADTADVELTDDKSSAQGLGINQTPILSAVPVQYMECHSGAFEVGDKCVVKFTAQDWEQPKVVGFVDHPRSCRGAVNFSCIPATEPEQWGWTRPLVGTDGVPLNGGKGTPATSLNQSYSAVHVPVRINPDTGLVEFAPARMKRAQASSSFTSGLSDINREWVSPDRSLIVSTALGDVRVGAQKKGVPHSDPVYWACVMDKLEPTPDNPGAKAKYLAAWTYNAPLLRVFTRPLAGPENIAWTQVISKSMADYDPDVMDPTLYAAYPTVEEVNPQAVWLRKGARNVSGNICSMWVQAPKYWRVRSYGRTGKWAWILDFDINTGDLTSTAALTETVNKGGTYVNDATETSQLASQTSFYSQSGTRQIDFEYAGDAKTYTELVFSGRYDLTVAGARVYGYQESHWNLDISYVGTLSIVLTKGAYSVKVWEEIYDGAWGDNMPQAEHVQFKRCNLYHYGNGALCYDTTELDYSMSTAAGTTTVTAGTKMQFVLPDLAQPLTLELAPQQTGTAIHNGVSRQQPNYEFHTDVYSGPGGPDTIGLAALMTNRLEYRRYLRAGEHPASGTWLNFRVLDNAYLLSVTSYSATGYTNFYSDPALFAAFQIDPVSGVLKHIKLT